jgi:DnaJ-class molecular chaperone
MMAAKASDTRSMVGLFYVLKDEKCGDCKGIGTTWDDEMGDTACFTCEGKGFRTFKVELSAAIKELEKVIAL